jgi:hypothetical protein
MCKFVPRGDAKSFWPRTVNIPYTTAYRYITFAKLIMNYPKLLVCDLEFSEITAHYSHFIEYLKTDNNLAAKLMTPVNISVREIQLEIKVENTPLDLVKFQETPDITLYEHVLASKPIDSFYNAGIEAMCTDEDVDLKVNTIHI